MCVCIMLGGEGVSAGMRENGSIIVCVYVRVCVCDWKHRSVCVRLPGHLLNGNPWDERV